MYCKNGNREIWDYLDGSSIGKHLVLTLWEDTHSNIY